MQRGSSLLENLVALVIFGVIAVVFLNTIASTALGAATIEGKSTAEILARTQIEDIKSLPYDDSNDYAVTVLPPPGYTILVNVADVSPVEYPNTLQKITVTVNRGSRGLITLEIFKVNR